MMNTRQMQFPSNLVRDIERQYRQSLEGLYGDGEARMLTRMIFEDLLGWSHTELLLRREETVNQSDLLRFHWALEALKRGRPIQYVIGYTHFCGCRIDVDESVLIPRPETEEIVQRVIEMLQEHPPQYIADLCTGSGCIAIALAKRWPSATVTAADISEAALQTARRNARRNGVQIDFHQGNLLKKDPLPPYQYNLIISNPPYVMEQEQTLMRCNVLDYEPTAALFVPDEAPLQFYEAIAAVAERRLAKDGLLVVEINEQLPGETIDLLRPHGFECEAYRDFNGKARMVAAKKKETPTKRSP